ncbi:MAG: sugar kinase [Chloroflexi bacterium]|nr:sugar kinase [Chloroflexota bacterium]
MVAILSIGEALVEVMRAERDLPLDRPGSLVGPYPSGAPAIMASAAARLGASVGFCGTVGEDAFGDCVLRRLLADGIDCAALRRTRERPTGIAFVAYASTGERSFLFTLAHSAAALVNSAQLPPGYLDGVRYLHVMGSALTLSDSLRETIYRTAEHVHAHGGAISLDPNLRAELMPLDRIRSVCEPIVRLASIVMPSGVELTTLTGTAAPAEGAAALLARGVQLVALKQGALGSTLYTADGAHAVPPYTVTEVDPTGAGDCYDAALLVALSEDWPLASAGLFANAVGALSTTRMGPMEGAFSRPEVLAFMASQGRPLP